MDYSSKTKILFVCTQNVFRSMSAHYLSLKYLNDKSLEDKYEIDSCGTVAYDWESPYSETLQLLRKKGVDSNLLNKHTNKPVYKDLVKQNQYIICMTNNHKKYIVDKFQATNVYLFNEIAFGQKSDLEDDNEANFRCSLEQFIEKTVNHIDANIKNVFNTIEKMEGRKN